MKSYLMEPSPFDQYGHNLTYLAKRNVLSPLKGYEASIARILQILLQREKHGNKYNPLFLDRDGTTRWRVIVEVARRMATGEVPDPLPTRQIVALNYKSLFADLSLAHASYSPTFPHQPLPDGNERNFALTDSEQNNTLEQLLAKYFPGRLWPSLEEWVAPNIVLSRLQMLFLAVRQTEGQVLLFINHFHRLVGGEQGYAIDASVLLKPALARQEIQCIGACMPDQYQKYIERDAAISRRLQECYLEPDEQI